MMHKLAEVMRLSPDWHCFSDATQRSLRSWWQPGSGAEAQVVWHPTSKRSGHVAHRLYHLLKKLVNLLTMASSVAMEWE